MNLFKSKIIIKQIILSVLCNPNTNFIEKFNPAF